MQKVSRGVVPVPWCAIGTGMAAQVPVVLAMLLVTATVGTRVRERLVGAVRRVETRTGFSLWLLVALLIYWIARLALDARGLISVVS